MTVTSLHGLVRSAVRINRSMAEVLVSRHCILLSRMATTVVCTDQDLEETEAQKLPVIATLKHDPRKKPLKVLECLVKQR